MNISNKYGIEKLSLELTERQKITVVLETAVAALLCLLGFILNFIFIFTMYRSVKLRKVAIVFIFELALCDVFTLATIFPFMISSSVSGGFNGNIFWCQIQAYWASAVSWVSYQTVALSAINRYVCLLHPKSYNNYFRLRYTLYFLLIAWLVACSTPLFDIFRGHVYIFHPGFAICVESNEHSEDRLVKNGFFAFLPFVIASFCYFRIYVSIQRKRRRLGVYVEDSKRQPEKPEDEQLEKTETKHIIKAHKEIIHNIESKNLQTALNRQKSEMKKPSTKKSVNPCNLFEEDIKMTKLFLIIAVFFFVCRFPMILTEMFDISRKRSKLPRQIYLLAIYIVGINSFLNPVVCCMINNVFRKECFKALNYLRQRVMRNIRKTRENVSLKNN